MWGLLVGLRTTVASYAVLFLNLSHVLSLGLRKLQRANMAFEKKKEGEGRGNKTGRSGILTNRKYSM
jgi:hypothetical protein